MQVAMSLAIRRPLTRILVAIKTRSDSVKALRCMDLGTNMWAEASTLPYDGHDRSRSAGSHWQPFPAPVLPGPYLCLSHVAALRSSNS
jgi:hypothetical protein